MSSKEWETLLWNALASPLVAHAGLTTIYNSILSSQQTHKTKQDNIEVAGFPTQYGCPAWDSACAKENAKCVYLLLKAGARGIGKSSMSELAFGAEGKQARFMFVFRNGWSLQAFLHCKESEWERDPQREIEWTRELTGNVFVSFCWCDVMELPMSPRR